ncbi:MAG TPA: hypothetical protein EYP69_00735 [Bacteroidales bacterium]|nr:hypothetical protein [Bacteroidales bacterium]
MEVKLFKWEDRFVLNNKLLDRQHEKFIAIINEFSMAIDSQDCEGIHHVFYLLIHYVENYLIDTNIKLLECNNVKYLKLKDQQNKLLERVKKYYRKFNTEKPTCLEFYNYLIEWFVDYIDMYKKEGYASCL